MNINDIANALNPAMGAYLSRRKIRTDSPINSSLAANALNPLTNTCSQLRNSLCSFNSAFWSNQLLRSHAMLLTYIWCNNNNNNMTWADNVQRRIGRETKPELASRIFKCEFVRREFGSARIKIENYILPLVVWIHNGTEWKNEE